MQDEDNTDDNSAPGDVVVFDNAKELRKAFWQHLHQRHRHIRFSSPLGYAQSDPRQCEMDYLVPGTLGSIGVDVGWSRINLWAQHYDRNPGDYARRYFVTTFKMDLHNTRNWDAAADWVKTHTDHYVAALTDIIGKND